MSKTYQKPPQELTFPEGYVTTQSWSRAQSEPLDYTPINNREYMIQVGEGSHHRIVFTIDHWDLKVRCDCMSWRQRGFCAHVASVWWHWINRDFIVYDEAGCSYRTPPHWLEVPDREVKNE